MPKVYGDRWEIVGNLKEGGQAIVFRVRDRTNSLGGEYALKRVINAERHNRFEAEIEAIKRLQHPNIISLIDHSALEGGSDEKQFLVMPVAEGGDLSDPKRAITFKGAIDATLTVALQIAEAIAAAHAAGVVHRDVKPANILFENVGHHVWLADFGICLLREKPRTTADREVVGPRGGFMAPECEDGGQLEVTAAVDIYSLGKLIYFMLSGGRPLPREKIDDPGYVLELGEGSRIHLLQVLLRRMICPLNKRIKDMADVVAELCRIEAWTAPAASPLGEHARTVLSAHTAHVSKSEQIHQANRADREAELRTASLIKQGFDAWISNELELAAHDMRAGGAVCEVSSTESFKERIQAGTNTYYLPMGGWQLAYASSPRAEPQRQVLSILLCSEAKMTVTIREGMSQSLPSRLPERDSRFVVVPYYNLMLDWQHRTYSDIQGFVSRRNAIGTSRLLAAPISNRGNPVKDLRVQRLMGTFINDVCQSKAFAASQWPAAMDELRASLSEMLEIFIEEIRAPTIFPGL